MNRRSFLSLLAGAGAASATSYFFAPIGGWKSDVIAHAPRPQVYIDANTIYVDGMLSDQLVSLNGLRYHDYPSTTGDYLGISRAHRRHTPWKKVRELVISG